MTPDDIYSLESWLREKALEAHNAASEFGCCSECPARIPCEGVHDDCSATVYEFAMNEAIAKIQNMRCNQRPHVTLAEEE